MKKSTRISTELPAQKAAGMPSTSPQPFPRNHRPDAGRRGSDPLEYRHPYPSMKDYAQLLALRYEHGRTRQSCYRQLRLLADHFNSDPALLNESQVRDYFLHVKTAKHWKPKTVQRAFRQRFPKGLRELRARAGCLQ